MAESPFARVYESGNRKFCFWVNMNNVDVIDIYDVHTIGTDGVREQIDFHFDGEKTLKGCYEVVEEDYDKVKKYLGMKGDTDES